MSKIRKVLNFILILVLFSMSGLFVSNQRPPIKSDNQSDKNFNDFNPPKRSGYTITEKWNYTASNINDVEISLDGNYLALVQDSDTNLSLFHKTSNETLWNYEFSPGTVNSFDISADGKYLSIGSGRDVYLFDNSEANPAWSKTFLWKYHIPSEIANIKVAISGNGKYTAMINQAKLTLLDNTAQLDKWDYINSHGIEEVDIGYNPIEGRYYIAIYDNAGNITLFDDTNNIPLWTNNTSSTINSLKISDDGSYILAKVDDDKVYFFDNSIESPKSALWTYQALNTDYVNIDISADGKSMIIVEENKVHYLNNTSTNPKEQEWEVQATSGYLREGCISGDGKYILAGAQEFDMIPLPYGIAKLYNRTKTQPKIEDWNVTMAVDVPHVAISGFGNYFALFESSVRLHFYHHDVPLPKIISGDGGGDDDDDDGEEAAIPFGNYYLIFACVAIISLIVIIKKKLVFKTK